MQQQIDGRAAVEADFRPIGTPRHGVEVEFRDAVEFVAIAHVHAVRRRLAGGAVIDRHPHVQRQAERPEFFGLDGPDQAYRVQAFVQFAQIQTQHRRSDLHPHYGHWLVLAAGRLRRLVPRHPIHRFGVLFDLLRIGAGQVGREEVLQLTLPVEETANRHVLEHVRSPVLDRALVQIALRSHALRAPLAILLAHIHDDLPLLSQFRDAPRIPGRLAVPRGVQRQPKTGQGSADFAFRAGRLRGGNRRYEPADEDHPGHLCSHRHAPRLNRVHQPKSTAPTYRKTVPTV